MKKQAEGGRRDPQLQVGRTAAHACLGGPRELDVAELPAGTLLRILSVQD